MNTRAVCLIAVWVIAAVLAVASPARAASFDCAKARGGMEAMICHDPVASDLDSQLAETYDGALAAVEASSRQSLIVEQRDWVRYTRALCRDAACLRQAYGARIAVLARNETVIVDDNACETPAGAARCQTVLTHRDPSIRIRSFNKTLADEKKPGRIIGCTSLISLPVGFRGSNDSFGGYCVLADGASRVAVKICNDDMFGHFAMQPVEAADESRKALIDFTARECFGG